MLGKCQLTVASGDRTDGEPRAWSLGDETMPCTGGPDLDVEGCSRRVAVCGGPWRAGWRGGVAAYLSAWRWLSGRRYQQAACRCRAPGSHRSQRASGRAGNGCHGRSATEGGREVAMVPANSLAQPWPGTPSQAQPCHRSLLTLLRATAPRSLCHAQARRDSFCPGLGCLRAASCQVRRFPFGVCVPHSRFCCFGVT